MSIEQQLHIQSTNNLAYDVEVSKTNGKAVLNECVRTVLTKYFNDLEGHPVDNLYQLVMTEVETPLLETVLDYTNGNQSKAANILGINRGTLRKKLKQYNLAIETSN